MIMKDFRYIIKRILIGLGIILGLSFIKSCNVYALEDTSNMTFITSFHHPNNFDFSIWYNSDNNSIYGRRTDSFNTTKEQTVLIPDNYNYLFYATSSASSSWSSPVYLLNTTWYTYTSSGVKYLACTSVPCNKIQLGWNTNRSSNTIFDLTTYNYTTQSGSAWSFNSFDGNYTVPHANFDIKDSSDNIVYNKNIDVSIGIPEIVSLNATLNTDDDVLVSVSFAPEFSIMDTVNYKYYAWFDGYKKLQLTENNTSFNTRNNTTFYVEITDFQGNTIDSETYTVSRIGQFDFSEYDILFSVETYTESDTLNEQKPIDYIDRVDIDTTFMPKSVYLKYQYQFVNDGDSITNNWTTVNSQEITKNNFIYTTHDNGTLYTQILDLEDNFLYSESYTITSIGMVKYYANDTGVGSFFNKITDKLDYSGPISSLISVPIRLFSSLLTESSKSCTSYSFGTLLGSEITFSCVNVENYIGSNLYNLLDLLMSFGVVLGIIHFIKKQYSKFMSMNDKTDDIM